MSHTLGTALAAAHRAGIKKITITIDVPGFNAPVEAGITQPTKFEALLGDKQLVATSGKDILDGIATIAERVEKHPPPKPNT